MGTSRRTLAAQEQVKEVNAEEWVEMQKDTASGSGSVCWRHRYCRGQGRTAKCPLGLTIRSRVLSQDSFDGLVLTGARRRRRDDWQVNKLRQEVT